MTQQSLSIFESIRPHWTWWRRLERLVRKRYGMPPSDAERLEWFQRLWISAIEENERLEEIVYAEERTEFRQLLKDADPQIK